MKPTSLLRAINETSPAATPALDVLWAANDLAVSATGTLTVPYGDYPVMGRCNGRPEHMIQRIDGEAAAALNDDLAAQHRQLGDGFRGAPVYIGHPDDPEWRKDAANQPLDKKAYAWIKAVNTDTGKLVLAPEWGEAGEQLRKNRHFGWHSPHWDLRVVAINERGVKIVRPIRLKSTGLTNSPNIPASAVNDLDSLRSTAEGVTATNNNTGDPMDPRLSYLLGLLGLADKATEEEVKTAATVKIGAINEAQSARARAEGMLATERATWETEKKSLAGQVMAANEATKTERKLRADQAIATAINEGRITLADKDAKLGELVASNDGSAFAALAALPVKVKTVAKTTALPKLAAVNEQTSDAGKQLRELVAKHQKETGRDFTTAWNEVKATPQGRALLETMQQPGS